jgi:hypothetical protein
MATPSELRTWAAENRLWAAQTKDPKTAAALRKMAEELDALATAKQALDSSEPDDPRANALPRTSREYHAYRDGPSIGGCRLPRRNTQ